MATATPVQPKCFPPPQTYQVELSYSGEEEAGRFASAARDISPGELVLASLPYTLVFNPSEFTSGLYLAASASQSKAGASTAESSSASGASSSHKKKKSAAAAATSGPALWESGSAAATAGEDSGADVPPMYTTCASWCSGCLSPINPGAWLVNAVALRDAAIGISAVQEATEEALAARVATSAPDSDPARGDAADDGEKEKKTLKKPTKVAKMRKDAGVELRQRLHDAALVQREAIFYAHRQRAQGEGFQASLNRYDDWWSKTEATATTTTTTAEEEVSASPRCVVGCTGCGVLVYCSRACWESTHAVQHVASGECAVLRRVYPRIMKEYFAMSGGGAGGAGGGGGKGHKNSGSAAVSSSATVVMPGLPEVLLWARSTSEEKSLEAQSMLMAATVFCRAVKEGHGERWWQTKLSEPVDGEEAAQVNHATTTTAIPQRPNATSAAPAHPPSTSTPKGPAATTANVVTESSTVPREVIALQETRQRLGLTGKVQVMDDVASTPYVATRRPTHTASVNAEEGQSSEDKARAASPSRQRLTTSGGVFYNTDTAVAPAQKPTPPSSNGLETAARQELVVPTYGDMASMITNLSVLSKDRRAVFASYYRRFVKLFLPWLPVFDLCAPARGDLAPGLPQLPYDLSQYHLPETVFLRLCAAAQCNSFGVYSKDDRCVGFAVYPEASYFNHSCYPNLCRVMRNGARSASFYALRPIQRSEALTICYTDVQEQSTAERRRNLLHTYRFFCQCERCVGNVAVVVGGGESERIGSIALCMECPVRGYLRPVPSRDQYPSAALAGLCARVEANEDPSDKDAELPSWDLDAVPLKRCTVCQRTYKNE